jgi:hypothetical protein
MTLWHIGVYAARAPKRGAWLLGHFICMASTTAGALYLLWYILATPDAFYGPTDAPEWMRTVVLFRSVTACMIVPASVLQIGLVALGRYGYHRWLGRTIVRITTASTAFTLLLSTSAVAVGVVGALLCLEMLAYFGFMAMNERRAGYSVAPGGVEPAEAVKDVEAAIGGTVGAGDAELLSVGKGGNSAGDSRPITPSTVSSAAPSSHEDLAPLRPGGAVATGVTQA